MIEQSERDSIPNMPEDSGQLEMVNPAPELLRKKKKKKIAAKGDEGLSKPANYLPTFSQAFQ